MMDRLRTVVNLILVLLTMVIAGCQTPGRHGDEVMLWLTSDTDGSRLKSKLRLGFSDGQGRSAIKIHVSDAVHYQQIDGFGAALTASSAWLLDTQLTTERRATVLDKLFSPTRGIGLNMVRIPMGASDYARQAYTYLDLPRGQTDADLQGFTIAEDQKHIIPILKEIKTINPALRIFASPWSPPAWMKLNGALNGGRFDPRFTDAYAGYFEKFIDAYGREGLAIDAVSIQNEPGYATKDYPSMMMTVAEQQRMAQKLGRRFASRAIPTKIFVWDHNWQDYDQVLQILNDPVAARFIKGSAWHGYDGLPEYQSVVHDAHPNKAIYFTEITGTEAYVDFSHNLNWSMHYVLIGSLRHWAQAVMYWNLVLDENNGPHLKPPSEDEEQQLRGIVQLNTATSEIDYQVEYFTLGHLSRFVQSGAMRIDSHTHVDGRRQTNVEPPSGWGTAESVAFINPDGSKVLVVLNPGWQRHLFFDVVWQARHFSYTLPPESVVTFIWR